MSDGSGQEGHVSVVGLALDSAQLLVMASPVTFGCKFESVVVYSGLTVQSFVQQSQACILSALSKSRPV